MKKYSKYIKPYKAAFILGPIMMLTEVFGEVWIPKLMSFIINEGVANRDISTIFRYGGIMLLACLVMIIGGTLGNYFAVKASVCFSADLRTDLFKNVQSFSFSNLDDFSTGSLVTRLTNDVQQIQNLIAMALRMALRSPGMLIGGCIMALSINKSLGIIILCIIPLLGLCIFIIMKTAYPKFNRMQDALDKLNNGIQETMTNERVVKSFVREEYEKEKFENNNAVLRDRTLDAMNTVIFILPVMGIFMNIATVLVVWFGGNIVINGNMQIGDLTAFITYITQILISLMLLAMVILGSSRAMASIKRISEVLDTKTDISDDDAKNKDKKVGSGKIEFRNVYFSYPELNESGFYDPEHKNTGMEEVLFDISFTINSGETVGVLGSTGCGKTSMVQLIPRLFDVTKGRILVDDTDVKDYSLKNLRDGVSMVLQHNTLFSGTITENLRWGNEDATDEEIIAAAKAASAHSFVEQFEEGFDKMIEQGGANVSGGQKQRLCIARALLKNPKILILDDSTSAVDTATEAEIRRAFSEELKDTTKIIIAQRIGSVKDADRIIVMDEGRIVDIGSHSELIERCNTYQEIYYSQVEEKREEEA